VIYLTSAKVGFILFGRMLDIVSKDTMSESGECAIFTMSTGINDQRMFCNSKRFSLETRFWSRSNDKFSRLSAEQGFRPFIRRTIA